MMKKTYAIEATKVHDTPNGLHHASFQNKLIVK